MKEKYINEKITTLKEKIKKEEYKQLIIKFLTSPIEAFTGVLGAITFLGGISFGLGLLAVAGLSHLKRKRSTAEHKKIVKNLENQIKHLEKVKNTGLDGSNKLDSKRKNKIAQLQKQKKKYQKSKSTKNKIMAASSGVALLGSIIFPPAAPFITTGWAILTSIISKKKSQDTVNQSLTSTRIANLVNDVNITKIDAATKKVQEQIIKSNENNSSNQAKKVQVKQKEENKNSQKKNHDAVTEYQNKLANKYIESLEHPASKYIPKQKVK